MPFINFQMLSYGDAQLIYEKFISNIFTSVFFKIILSAPKKWLNKVVLLSKPKLNKYETWLGLQLNLN